MEDSQKIKTDVTSILVNGKTVKVDLGGGNLTRLSGVVVLQPAIHGGAAAPRGALAFEPILLHCCGVWIALVATALQSTSPHTLNKRASFWSVDRQGELRCRRPGPSGDPTRSDQR